VLKFSHPAGDLGVLLNNWIQLE